MVFFVNLPGFDVIYLCFSAFRLLRSPMTCIALRPSILPPLIPAVCAGANLMFWCMRSNERETIHSFHFYDLFLLFIF